MKKNNKGITLIVLVITIIIVLILAGISIVILSGNNGLITKTKQAKQNTLDSQNYENSVIAQYENFIDESSSKNEKIFAEEISFIPEDSNWTVKNVKEALDYLYNK